MVKVRVERSIKAECHHDKALDYLWDLNNMPHYEPKVESILVKKANGNSGTYSVRGKFAGMKWGGKFDYRLHKRGFESGAIKLPVPIQVRGWFIVAPRSKDSCLISHTEEYNLPVWALPISPFLKAYLRWAIRREMTDLQRCMGAGYAELARGPARPS